MFKIRKHEEDLDCPIYVKVKKLGLENVGLKSLFPHINIFYQISQFHLFRSIGELIKSFFLWIKYRHQRLKYGISEYDSYGLNSYIEVIFKNAVKMLNNGRWGHPYNMTDEEWEEKLQWLISKLEFITEDNYDSEYWQKYQSIYQQYKDRDNFEVVKARQEWVNYVDNIELLKLDAKKEVFDFLKEYWDCLWD